MKKNELLIFPLLGYLRQRRKFLVAIFIAIMVDLLLASWFIRVIPDCWYLRAYLPWTAVLKTERFLQGKMHIQVDSERGWRNQTGAQREVAAADFSGRENLPGMAHRLLILGDSRMNYSNVVDHETLTSYLENSSLEVINAATEMYGLDQSVLALEEGLERFQPEFVVLALGTDTGDHLDCHYLPFLYPTVGLPLLKPKYIIVADSLKKMPVTRFLEKKALLFNPELMQYLKANDPHYVRFEWFKKSRTTPFLCLTSLAREWAIETAREFNLKNNPPAIDNQPLVEALILHSRRLAEKHHVKLIYLLLPQKNDLKFNHDQVYRQLAQFLVGNSIHYINVFSLFNEHADLVEIFDRDGVHYTAPANQILAQAVLKIINSQNSQVAR